MLDYVQLEMRMAQLMAQQEASGFRHSERALKIWHSALLNHH